MKYVKMSITTDIPLKKEAEIVKYPTGENLKCVKIGKNYYDIDIMLMKYNKKEDCWIETDLDDILDEKYVSSLDSKFLEIKSKPKKI
jgi:hypothetical protein